MNILDKLSEILNSLAELNDENFDFLFYNIRHKMIEVRNEIALMEKEGFFNKNFDTKNKIEKYTKLISEEYDNKINLWKSKISELSEMLITSRNEKKILSYMR